MPPARVALYAATLGVLVLSVRAVLLGPPPLAWSVLAGLLYLALLLASGTTPLKTG